ncbi:polysaccharide deacetylase family protein [Cohnella lupini]|uniref:Peptidoglycan/xylan/chitin deacetylase (PgdA/CDA1 family) n=1 Tax=Cohnella lupini TaxID=1294267 RepID=A0A3D9IJ73_9BACL|nr:polysaccharide deacetylase family protein [Cohnella lupini]RED61599.1 peptidoglycan/xylan/chitin deacetylase (PgdA/CDA1 family) [Cohnella lupini]
MQNKEVAWSRLYPLKFIYIFIVLGLICGCEWSGGREASGETNEIGGSDQTIVRYTGAKSPVISTTYTARKELSLTFSGLGDKDTMNRILDQLDTYRIKATFFVPGMRVAEEPGIAKAILSRGHEIENNTLNRLDMTKLSYEQAYNEIRLSNEVIRKETGVTPRYLRTKSGDYNDDVRLAAAHNGLEAVVVYSLFLHNWQGESDEEKSEYVRKYINRGGIINIDAEENFNVVESISIFAQAANDIGYKFISLDELIEHGSTKKPLDQIKGYDAAKVNPDFENSEYKLIYDKETNKKEIALTFDDWGTDYTVTKILDILALYDVKATFFLRAKGVEANPNLARAMIEEGHDVANHSYSHPVVTTLTPTQLQEDVVKAHQVITEAIQQQPTMLFRPPTGEIDDRTAKAISAIGYPDIALYDVTTFDWDSNNSAEDIVNSVLEQTQNGSVILLHMLDDIHTIEALPIAIERLKKQGYTFVKMADLIGS